MTSFYPSVGSRATTQLGISRLLFQINHDENAIQELQKQLSTGRKLTKPSDDPGAAIRAMAAQRGKEFKSQVDDNLGSADTMLSATEATLAQAQSLLIEMRGVAVSGTGTTLSEAEIAALSQQVQSGLDSLLQLSNSKFRDQYIFAGSDLRESPIEYDGQTVRFTANAEELLTISDYGSTISANVTSQDAFGVRSSRQIGSADLDAAIAPDTPLAHLNRGAGVRSGAITLSNGVDVLELDLSTAYNISDVMEKLDTIQLGGRDLSVSLSSTGINVTYTDGLPGLLRIGEVGTGNMAGDLGINNVNTTGLSPVNGTDLDPIITESTRLTQLFGGAGLPQPDSFLLSQGGNDYIITTANLETVEDFMNQIRISGAAVEVSLDETGRHFSIQSTESGSTLSIGENGSTLATQMGIRSFDLDTPVDSLNFGQGIATNDSGDDLVLTRTNGSRLSINLSGVRSVSDVLDRINNNVDNQSPTLRITASLADTGNGITLSAATGAQPITVGNAGGSQAAWGLGLIPIGDSVATGAPGPSGSTIRGADVSGIEVDGAFNTLIRLREAIESGRPEMMERVATAIEDDIQRLSLTRGFLGARQQSVESMIDLSAEQQIRLTEAESDELDADLAQVISDLNARQAAMQASLQLMGQSTRLTLWDYL